MALDFYKYEGAGNDFILLRDEKVTPAEVRRLCDRHRGIGADGLMVLSPATGYNFRMEYYNADGSRAAMCGNGARCIALFAHHQGIGGEHLHFIGDDGPHTARIVSEEMVEVGMRDVASAENLRGAFLLNTGVPHYVEFVDDIGAVDIRGRGREIRNALDANVNFASAEGNVLHVRTYERGVEDETLACGTGAVAAAISAFLKFGKRLEVRVAGGKLSVGFTPAGGGFRDITLTGPARKVFAGTTEV
jgi:diaminopimelate epimerase